MESNSATKERSFMEDAQCSSLIPPIITVVSPQTHPQSLRQRTASPEFEHQPSEAELAEIRSVLESARGVTLRGVQRHCLHKLAELGRVEQHAAGSVLEGSQAWTSGWCLVLTGRASVVFEVDGTDTVAASLQHGDSFGWGDAGEDSAAAESWERLSPRLVVGSDQPLRCCRLHWDTPTSVEVPPLVRHLPRASTRSKNRVFSKSTGSGDLATQSVRQVLSSSIGGLSDWLAGLWLAASASPAGVGSQPGGLLQAHFLAAVWAPLLAELEQHKTEIRNRKAKGYRIHDCFPLQGRQIVELRDQVAHLTELWYGSMRGGNLSALYRWFTEAMELLGVTAYSFDTIPQDRSADGWAVSIDGVARAAALKDKGSLDANYVAAGGAKQRQGRSAIDNTVLRNVFLPREAAELLVGRRLRKIICRFLVIRQICLLRRLSEQLDLDLLFLASDAGASGGHTAVRAVLQSLPAETLSAMGAFPDSLCTKMLRERGALLAGFGQLPAEDQKAVANEARRLLGFHGEGLPAREDAEDVFERLVAWCRDRPGEFFEGSKHRHVEVKIMGLLAGKVIIIKRSCMERFSLARYFPLAWHRTQPLWGVFASGPLSIRSADMMETSHVRANECPYASLHGMSLSGGGFAVDQRSARNNVRRGSKGGGYSLLMELQWVRDPSANVENWFLTDIEKILQEAWQLNPRGRRELMLPGEVLVNVGQNPKVGSSIRETQHTQLCEGSLSSYKVLQLTSNPRYSQKLGASIDLVEVGPTSAAPEHCGLFLRLCTERPTQPQLLEFLVGLRLRLLSSYGGGDAVDFLVLTVSDENGGFVVLFAPISQLLKIGDEKPDFATWANPMTGESSESAGLHEARVDFGKGVGQFLVAKPPLREQILAGGEELMRRIWAFNRVPGAREVVEGFLAEHHVFE